MPYLIGWIVAAGLFFLMLMLAGCAGAAETPARITLADAVNAFDRMILSGQSRISKWSLDHAVPVWSTAPLSETESRALADTLGFVAARTRLALHRSASAMTSGIAIETVGDLGARGSGIHNVGRTLSSFVSASGEMEMATISILRDWEKRDSNLINRIMPHEVLHAVGFQGHAPDGFDSVMGSGGPGAYGPSAWDSLFLTVLYDERLPLGVPRVFALPIVCRLLNERLTAERGMALADLRPQGDHPHCARLAAVPVVANGAADRVAIAWAYLNGLGIARDLDEAERWAKRSKAAGDADADYLIYAIGRARLTR